MSEVYSGFINLIRVSDGTQGPAGPAGPSGGEANSYYVKANQPEIIKYPQVSSSKDNYSPKTLIFSLNLRDEQVSLEGWTYTLAFTGSENQEYKFNNELTEFLYVSNNLLYFELDNFMKQEFPSQGTALVLEKEIQEILQEDLSFLNLVFFNDSLKQRAAAQLVARMRTSRDLAKFGIYADGVTAAIQNTILNFDANGLLIRNGGIQIQNQSNEPVCYFDEFGNFKIVGSGTFGGRIEATEGSFTGMINAQGGRFSGTVEVGASSENISIDKILIDGTNGLIKSSNFDSVVGSGFALKANGEIEANSIALGKNAYIKEYLQVGDNCFIRNPAYTEDNSSFISVTNEGQNIFVLDKYGRVHLGKGIMLDGQNSTIKAVNGSWDISPEVATFNNIVAKGTIKTSVFEKGEIQTVGGAFIVRPSTLISSCKKAQEVEIYLVTPQNIVSDFSIGDCCEIENQTYFIIYIGKGAEGENTELYLSKEKELNVDLNILTYAPYPLLTGKMLVDYGKDGDITIAINSSGNSSSLPQRAISILQTEIEENSKILRPKIVLGDMTEQNYGGLTGYGLYADNVYLKGQIISESLNVENSSGNFYSGIHTSSKVLMPQSFFPNKRVGEILFWAGARDSNSEAIQNAPFKVDSYGNLYAGSGYFKGSIISEATISAAKIQTATLEGWTTSNGVKEAALTITAENAINFQNSKDGVLKMSLNADNLFLSIPFLVGNSITISPKGSIEAAKVDVSESISLNEGSLFLQRGSLQSQIKQSDAGLDFLVSDEVAMRLSSTQTYISDNLQCGKNVYFSNIMEYRQVVEEDEIIGYDLYIKE